MRTSFLDNAGKKAHPARRLAFRGLLLCLAIVFSYLEAQLPFLFIPIPGFKLGFANLVITFCAYTFGLPDAFFLSIARILIVALLFGGWTGFWFSLCGALCSFLVLALLLRFAKDNVSPLGVSAACAAAHNIGQLIAAAVLLKSLSVCSYLPVLLVAGMLTGTITGVLVSLLLTCVPVSGSRSQKNEKS